MSSRGAKQTCVDLRTHRQLRLLSCRRFLSENRGTLFRNLLGVAVALGLLLASVATAEARDRPEHFIPLASRPAGHRGTIGAVRTPLRIPLPRPRPADAPTTTTDAPATERPAAGKSPADKSVEQALPAEHQTSKDQSSKDQPSACRLALTEEIAIAPSIPDIHGPGGCGGEDLVRLEAIVLKDKRKVTVKPAAILRCGTASAVADWIRQDVAPLASSLGSTISELDDFDSFECRGRNRVAGATLSEHGRANAIDVRGFNLANGRSIGLTDRTVLRDLRERILHSACSRFTTVLGPGSDGYHEDHIHLDLMQRRNGYRICHWDVWDPMPRVAPMLPPERPKEAPPREEPKSSQSTGDAAPQAVESNEGQADSSAADHGAAPPSRPSRTRKRQ